MFSRLGKRVVVVDAVRTPIGRYGGSLSTVRADDLAALVIHALLQRNPALSPSMIDEVYLGCSNQAGEDNRNIARQALLIAGLPESVAGCTVNRLCGSGLEAVNQASALLMLGLGGVVIAGGVESMSRAPFVMLKPQKPFMRGNQDLVDSTIGYRFVNPSLVNRYGRLLSLGETAEAVADKYNISRSDQDLFSVKSQQRYKEADASSRFSKELIPVELKDRVVEKDEHPRPESTYEKLAGLKPVFQVNGSVTAGNSSGINDGASALLLMTEEMADRLGCNPLAEILCWAVEGTDPNLMGMGPVPAVNKLYRQTGLGSSDIDLVEINEAFASQTLACIEQLSFDHSIVNVNGGAIALGHPLGASGARILTTLIYELARRDLEIGLATLCIGVGQGIATLVKRV